jgi:CTP synthase (UTP-ammonia lyase)
VDGSTRPRDPWIAVIGDRVEGLDAQDSIGPAVDHAAAALGVGAPDLRWFATDRIDLDDPGAPLTGAGAVWCAPGSPYRSLDGALAAIGWAREHEVPFLGTCAGFQHGVLEFARSVLGHTTAAHAEYDHDDHDGSAELFIDELLCSLVGQTLRVELVDPELRAIYGADEAVERYYCRFGLAPAWREPLHRAGLLVAGVDAADGDVRVMRLAGHPFHVLTLFVPQTSSAPGRPHPLITRLVAWSVGRDGGPSVMADGPDDRHDEDHARDAADL